MIGFVASRCIAAVALLVATTITVFAQSFPVPSYWLNQRGSEMKLYAIDPQGNFTGVYINHAAGFACQGTPFPLAGHVSGTTTIWHGLAKGSTLPTNWVLLAPPSPPLYGADLFTLQP